MELNFSKEKKVIDVKAELVEPISAKKDVLLHLSNKEAEELCTFLGCSSKVRRISISHEAYDDNVLTEMFEELKKIVRCR
jgi:predicted ATP-grasp superfamily ATP-dependent carboligase